MIELIQTYLGHDISKGLFLNLEACNAAKALSIMIADGLASYRCEVLK